MNFFNYFKKEAKKNIHLTCSSNMPEFQPQYIHTENGIQRVDGKPFTDEEVPYLIQIGYEKVTGRRDLLDFSYQEMMDKDKKEFTRIPSYSELLQTKAHKYPLSSTDIYFLKYVNGVVLEDLLSQKKFIAQYWYYDYGINITEELKKLFATGLLTFSFFNINKLKVEELKNILRHFNLPLSGKKRDLQQRISQNLSSNDIINFLGTRQHYFCATENGNILIDRLPDSTTKNIELENSCIKLILKYNFKEAVSLIDKFKLSVPSGITYKSVYNTNMDTHYKDILDSNKTFYTTPSNRDIEKLIRASIIFCYMYNAEPTSIMKIIQRMHIATSKTWDESSQNMIKEKLF